jgi:hypothetical protein
MQEVSVGNNAYCKENTNFSVLNYTPHYEDVFELEVAPRMSDLGTGWWCWVRFVPQPLQFQKMG